MKRETAFKRNLLLGILAALVVAAGCVPPETFTNLMWDEANWDDTDWGLQIELTTDNFV